MQVRSLDLVCLLLWLYQHQTTTRQRHRCQYPQLLRPLPHQHLHPLHTLPSLPPPTPAHHTPHPFPPLPPPTLPLPSTPRTRPHRYPQTCLLQYQVLHLPGLPLVLLSPLLLLPLPHPHPPHPLPRHLRLHLPPYLLPSACTPPPTATTGRCTGASTRPNSPTSTLGSTAPTPAPLPLPPGVVVPLVPVPTALSSTTWTWPWVWCTR